jgi:O-antigen/teichoic acid export membrane protein
MKIKISNLKTLFFENRTLKQTIFKNTFWLAVAEVIRRGIGFLIVAWLARHFGPATYGKFAFALSFVSLFTVFADFGFGTLTVREIAREKSKTAQYIDNIIAMKLILGLITLGLIFLVIQFLGKEPEVVKLVYFLGIYTVINTFAAFFQSIFQANEKMEYVTACLALQEFCLLGLIAFFILNKGSILMISYAYVGTALIGTLFSLAFIWRYFSKFFLKINLRACKEIISQVWPFGLSFLFVSIYYYFSSVLLGITRSNEEVGWYNAALRILFFVTPLTGILFSSFLPPIAKFFKESREKLNNICEKYAIIMFGIGIPLGFGGFVIAPELINFLYGNLYSNAIIPFKILTWAISVIFISSAFSTTLSACDRQKEVLKATSIGAIFNISLNSILIPKYGVIGAAIVTLLTEVVILVKVYSEFLKVVKIGLAKCLIPSLTSSILMAIFVLLIKEIGIYNPILLILFGILIYATIIYFKFNIHKKL